MTESLGRTVSVEEIQWMKETNSWEKIWQLRKHVFGGYAYRNLATCVAGGDEMGAWREACWNEAATPCIGGSVERGWDKKRKWPRGRGSFGGGRAELAGCWAAEGVESTYSCKKNQYEDRVRQLRRDKLSISFRSREASPKKMKSQAD